MLIALSDLQFGVVPKASLQRWLDVFGHLGTDPDKVGNMWHAERHASDALALALRRAHRFLRKHDFDMTEINAALEAHDSLTQPKEDPK